MSVSSDVLCDILSDEFDNYDVEASEGADTVIMKQYVMPDQVSKHLQDQIEEDIEEYLVFNTEKWTVKDVSGNHEGIIQIKLEPTDNTRGTTHRREPRSEDW